MAGQAVEVKGLKSFRKELRAINSEFGAEGGLPKAFRASMKEIANDVAAQARGIAGGMGGVQAKAAGSIKGYATQSQSSVGFLSGGIAGAAFWGMLRRTGWYAAARYQSSPRRQHPAWVGTSWEAGVAGQGPYAINDALAKMQPELLERFAKMMNDLADKAFPD